MKEYNFEFFAQKYTQKLVLLCFSVFLSLFLGSILLTNSKIFIILGSILSVLLPIIIFQYNRKNIKKYGVAKIFENYAEFNLDGVETIINYSDIKSYLIQDFNGTFLNLKLKDGSKFNISSNNSYCDTLQFGIFTQDLEKLLEAFKNGNRVDLIRRKNFFEYKWVFPFLLIITVAFIFMIIHSIYSGRKLPISSLLMTLGPLITFWTGYFSNRNKKAN